jgi:hypothetical protein
MTDNANIAKALYKSVYSVNSGNRKILRRRHADYVPFFVWGVNTMTVFPMVVTKSKNPYTVWVTRLTPSSLGASPPTSDPFEDETSSFFKRDWGGLRISLGFGLGLWKTGRLWMNTGADLTSPTGFGSA